jgi:probable HAF family extracellular repeat protein
MLRTKSIVAVLLFSVAAIGLYGAPEKKPPTSPWFTGLGDLAGGLELSVANGISADGKVVVGYSHSATGPEAFRWTLDDGMEGLGFPIAFAVSGDGAVVVGHRLRDGRSEPVRWTRDEEIACPQNATEYRRGAAQGVTVDGSTVVGVVGTGMSDAEGHDSAFRWRGGDRFAALTPESAESGSTDATAISGDGGVIVGVRRLENGHTEAFRWTEATGIVGLGCLAGLTTSRASAVSADGKIVVGSSSDYTTTRAFRWTEETGMVALGELGDASCDNVALAVSADGSVIVGCNMSRRGRKAFLWTAEKGMRSVQDMLAADSAKNGPLAGWRLTMATAVSADGAVIAGVGMNPEGEREAWIARTKVAAVEREPAVAEAGIASRVRRR